MSNDPQQQNRRVGTRGFVLLCTGFVVGAAVGGGVAYNIVKGEAASIYVANEQLTEYGGQALDQVTELEADNQTLRENYMKTATKLGETQNKLEALQKEFDALQAQHADLSDQSEAANQVWKVRIRSLMEGASLESVNKMMGSTGQKCGAITNKQGVRETSYLWDLGRQELLVKFADDKLVSKEIRAKG